LRSRLSASERNSRYIVSYLSYGYPVPYRRCPGHIKLKKSWQEKINLINQKQGKN
jgi:hypothetical protein